jgi:hypothetical protein
LEYEENGDSTPIIGRPDVPNHWEECGDSIDTSSKSSSRSKLSKRKHSVLPCIRYDPLERMRVESELNLDELREAYRHLNNLDFKQRQQDLEFYKYKGFWSWIRSMLLIDDTIMKKACSTDAYIYLLYLRWCAIFLFFQSIVSVAFLCPFYYFMATRKGKTTVLQELTVFEIVRSDSWVWIMFFVALAYSILGYRFVYLLVIQLKNFRYYKEETADLESDYEIAKKTVVIRNIPTNFSVKFWNNLLFSLFKERYEGFLAVSTLGRYQKLYGLYRHRLSIAAELNQNILQLYQTKGECFWQPL